MTFSSILPAATYSQRTSAPASSISITKASNRMRFVGSPAEGYPTLLGTIPLHAFKQFIQPQPAAVRCGHEVLHVSLTLNYGRFTWSARFRS